MHASPVARWLEFLTLSGKAVVGLITNSVTDYDLCSFAGVPYSYAVRC